MIIGIEVQRLFRRKKHGMEIVALEILRELQKKDHKNQFVIFAKDDVDKGCFVESKNFTIDACSKALFPVWEQMRLPRAVKNAAPDILHCTSNTAPLFCKIPLIVTIHDIIYLESINFSGSAYQNFGNIYRRIVVPRVAKNAAIILTVSEYEKTVIARRLKIPENKIRVIYNGVNHQFKPIKDQDVLHEFRQRYNLPAKFLLHFGNTAPKKNTIGVLEAYKMYCEKVPIPLPLVLTDCTSEHINGLLEQIKAPELIKHIQILDYIPFASIPCLYNLATIFLYPSLRESFGMPLIEAMACGVPVISSNSSAIPEIAGGAASLVDPTRPIEICDQIILLLSEKLLYNDRREKGFKNATRFSWENAALKTEAVYNELRPENKTMESVGIFDKVLAGLKFQCNLLGFSHTKPLTNKE